jgi:hypothetical protein
MFSKRFKKYFALMAALLVLGPCVAESPRILAGWYSPSSMENEDMEEFSETYSEALNTAESDDNLLADDNLDGYNAPEAAGKMESDFWWIFVDQISWGFPFRICVFIFVFSMATRFYSNALSEHQYFKETRISRRAKFSLFVALFGFSYSFIISATSTTSGEYYFIFTLFISIFVYMSDNFYDYKGLLLVSLFASLFWIFINDRLVHLTREEQYLLYDYVVRARISTPVYLLLGFLAETLLFVVPYYFLSRFGIEGGFSKITAA